jgi:hypothetical protein
VTKVHRAPLLRPLDAVPALAGSGLDVLLQSIDLEVAAEELVPTAPTVVWFDAVDIAVTVERRVADAILPIPFPVYAADSKTIGAITSELRAARTAPLDRAEDVSGRSGAGCAAATGATNRRGGDRTVPASGR